jgi:endonuclease/exonuclease/phosphatase (EEP) superfamily protein YafD
LTSGAAGGYCPPLRTSLRSLLVPLVLLSLGCAHKRVAEDPQPTHGVPVLRLLTYNVNYGIAGDAATIAAIRAAAADVALLEETNVAWERALRTDLATELPHMTFKHRGGAGGIAVLSREAPVEVEFLPPVQGGGWFPAVRVVIDGPCGRVQILGVHLRPAVSDGGSWVTGHFSTPVIRAVEMRAFVERLSPGLTTVVAGDFNEEEDGDASRFLFQHGFSSALARYTPERFTWRWPTALGELHKQLDHVFYDARLDVLSAEVRAVGRSDHLPVIAVVARR